MHKEKAIARYSDLLSEIATEISQTCSTRNSILDVYMGTSLPQLQLDLFKPILLENYAFLCACLKDEEVCEQLQIDAQDIAKSLDLDSKAFQEARVLEYANAADSSSLYTKFCMFIIRHKENAPNGNPLEEWDHKKLSSNTLLTLQLSAQRMREAAKTV